MRKNYESPRVEVIEVEMQGVLCGSVPGPVNPLGNTENIGLESFNF